MMKVKRVPFPEENANFPNFQAYDDKLFVCGKRAPAYGTTVRCKIELLDLLYMHTRVSRCAGVGMWADHNMTRKRQPRPNVSTRSPQNLAFPTQTEASNPLPWPRADSLTPKRALDEISDVLPGR